jgi:SAM-dependent methyltransferase
MRFAAFGFVPGGSPLGSLWRRAIGAQNLIKRIQADDILRVCSLTSNASVLDFGCGSGYFTVELAKRCARAVGFDQNPELANVSVPTSFRHRLEFQVGDGRDLSFLAGERFDVVLLSEVLTMTKEPAVFLRSASTALRPGGRLVVVNGCGHPVIEQMFRTRDPWLIRMHRWFPERFPPSYSDYEKALLATFQTAVRDRFLRIDDLRGVLGDAGFHITHHEYTPSWGSSAYVSRLMFVRYLRGTSLVCSSALAFLWHLWRARRAAARSATCGGLSILLSARQ